jgi:carboxy-terminal domain RNA polymerase II polypeptide A small phosphatase
MKLLVLDLDETLIYATYDSTELLDIAPDFWVGPSIRVFKRPGVHEFLDYALNNFRVSVWTAAGGDYALTVINNLFGSSESKLEFIFTSERCSWGYNTELMQRQPVKNLKKVKAIGHDLAEILHIDNTPFTFSLNYGNGIQVKDFTGHQEDTELRDLTKYLELIKDVPDVRPVDKRAWRSKI